MGYWSWDSSLSIGIDVIDAQHRRIVNYINELYDARHEKDSYKVSRVLFELVDYTRTHFVFEENLMKQAGYPLSDSHKKVHDAFVVHIEKFLREHESGKDITSALSSQLQIWLTNHIKNDDRDYSPYVIKMTNPGWIANALKRFFG